MEKYMITDSDLDFFRYRSKYISTIRLEFDTDLGIINAIFKLRKRVLEPEKDFKDIIRDITKLKSHHIIVPKFILPDEKKTEIEGTIIEINKNNVLKITSPNLEHIITGWYQIILEIYENDTLHPKLGEHHSYLYLKPKLDLTSLMEPL